MRGLLKKYKELLKATINPDDFTWDDLGFDEPMEGFKDVDDYLENGGDSEFDEEAQIKIKIYSKIIKNLENYIIYEDKRLAKIAKNSQRTLIG